MNVADAPTVVCIPLYGAHEQFKCCLRSMLRHTHRAVPILVADDADPDPAARDWVRELECGGSLRHTVYWLRQEVNSGFPANCNAAFSASAHADVAVVNSDCEVGAGWLEGLQSAAYADTNVASSTALTNHGTILSVPWRNRPQHNLPAGVSFERASARVRERSLGLRPRIPTIVGHCFFVRRSALELVGDFDETFAPGYGEEVDFSQRCLAVGLQHVVADDVFVLHRGGKSLWIDGKANPIQQHHERIIRARYPWYERAVEAAANDRGGPLARSIAVARQALIGLRVTVDGRILTPTVTGSQVNTLEFIHALWRTQIPRVRVVVPPDLGGYAERAFAELSGIETVLLEEALADEPDDIVHRPYQVSSEDDLVALARVADRVVLTHLDVIAYRNPTYFNSPDDWMRFRALTRASLAFADIVLFCTRQGADDAMADTLVDAERARVVPLGADHRFAQLDGATRRPDGAEVLDGTPFLLCLGTDFKHKNRVFALRVFEALRSRHGWHGSLVLVGPRVATGSSDGEEAGWAAEHDELSADVLWLPAVSEEEKAWLMQHAEALLYPTTYEGFGFLPFEAGLAGKPCFFSHTTSMAETLRGVSGIVRQWDANATADAVIEVLRDPSVRAKMVAELTTAVDNHPWDRTAALALRAYDDVLRMTTPGSRPLAKDVLEATGECDRLEAERDQFQSERDQFESERDRCLGIYLKLREDVGPTGFTLVGSEGHLPEDVQRAISNIVQRPLTRVPFLGGLRLARRVARRGRVVDGR